MFFLTSNSQMSMIKHFAFSILSNVICCAVTVRKITLAMTNFPFSDFCWIQFYFILFTTLLYLRYLKYCYCFKLQRIIGKGNSLGNPPLSNFKKKFEYKSLVELWLLYCELFLLWVLSTCTVVFLSIYQNSRLVVRNLLSLISATILLVPIYLPTVFRYFLRYEILFHLCWYI